MRFSPFSLQEDQDTTEIQRHVETGSFIPVQLFISILRRVVGEHVGDPATVILTKKSDAIGISTLFSWALAGPTIDNSITRVSIVVRDFLIWNSVFIFFSCIPQIMDARLLMVQCHHPCRRASTDSFFNVGSNP